MPDTTKSQVKENGRAHIRGCPKTLDSLINLIASDLDRYAGRANGSAFIKHFLFTPGFKYTTWMRTCGYLKLHPAFKWNLFYLVKYIMIRCRYKYGIAIPEYTVIGPGFFINRFGGIYIHGDVVIGRNVNLTHGVVLGYMNRGDMEGAPTIGDECFLGSGAKVIGNLTLGKRCAVGANAVVTKSFADDSVVGGIPAKILSMKGTEGYINWKTMRLREGYPGETI